MAKFNLNDIELRNKTELDLSRNSRIAELKELLSISLPEYEAFVLKYGAAEIVSMIRVYAPDDILENYQDFRDRWDGCYHWGDKKSMLSDDELQECIPIADTNSGDEFIVKIGDKSGIYVLPRDDDIVYYVGQDLSDIIDFALNSGKLYDANEYYSGNPPTKLWID
jgi:hypothetical protein